MPKKLSLQIRRIIFIKAIFVIFITCPACSDGNPALTQRTRTVIKNQRQADSIRVLEMLDTMTKAYIEAVPLVDTLAKDSLPQITP